MFSDILLLDAAYPFGQGEPFLKNEIESGILSEHNIYLTPVSVWEGEPFSVPKNVHVVRAWSNTKLLRLLDCVTGGIFTIFSKEFYTELVRQLRSGPFNMKRFIALLRFSIGAESKYATVCRSLRDIRFDTNQPLLIYAYWLHHHAYIAVKLKRRYSNTIAVARCHRYDLYEYRAPSGYIPFRKYILTNIDHIFPISQNGVDYLKEKYGSWITGKTTLSYLGTSDHGINQIHQDNRLHIVSCSNVIPVKRVHLLIEALEEIADEQIVWTHYGDGILRNDLIELAEKKLSSNIEWAFAGSMDNDTLMKIYQQIQIDLFINVSESEGLPVSIMEAMSFGVPVIATDVGGTKEIVHDRENGYLLPKDFKAKELSGLIIHFSRMSMDEKHNLRKNARQVWSEQFDAKKNYEKFYHELKHLQKEPYEQIC